jgi:predicted metal-dependent hydrolase
MNARSVRVSVFPGGEVRVSAPRLLPKLFIERFLEEKRAWVLNQIMRMEHVPKKKTKKEAREAYLLHKEDARALVQQRLLFFNAHYGLRYERISIRDQHSRWGSCSRKGNLNFNYRLVLIPHELADYVIVHELCHIKEFNHGIRFWSLVAECIPNYEELRARLHHHKHN